MVDKHREDIIAENTKEKEEEVVRNEEVKAKERMNETRNLLLNAYSSRQDLLRSLIDGENRDINVECGYPDVITAALYKEMHSREGIATRIIKVLPEESWAMDPEVFETEDESETEFEQAFGRMKNERQPWHYLARIDELSGIGRFGILLIGIDDGKGLNIPVDGVNEKGEKTGTSEHKLIYLKAFDESVVKVKAREADIANPRYGLPTMYSVTFQDFAGSVSNMDTQDVHWTRVIHMADNRQMSEVYGIPRIECVYNRLIDMRKILSGSGEMFWKGAFPGYAFEVNPELKDAELDTATIRTELENFQNSLQRYIAVTGVSVKSLSPQVAGPSEHIETQLKTIAISLGIPIRILFGSEEAKLASNQDIRTWNKRLKRRQEKYLSPMVVRPFVDRLIAMGCLPEPKEYFVEWEDLNTVTDEEKAAIAGVRTEALAKYVQGAVDQMIPPEEYLTKILGMSSEEAEVVLTAADKYVKEEEALVEDENDIDEEVVPVPDEKE